MTHHRRPAPPPAFALFTPAIAAAVFAPLDAHLRRAEAEKIRAAELAHLEKHKARAPWLEVAYRELGVVEDKVGSNPRILEYLHNCWNTRAQKPAKGQKAVDLTSDDTAWCSAFVNWCLGEVGIRGTGSASSLSWWKDGPSKKVWAEGKEVGTSAMSSQVPIGSIVVMSRDPSKWRGHVAFLWDRKDGRPIYLGGNQGAGTVENEASDRVSIASYGVPVRGCYWPMRACTGHSINRKLPGRR